MSDVVPLFPKDKVSGIFRGFSHGGLEFHADIVLPYQSSFQSVAMHGQFLLVQLATEDEAVLGRIMSFFSEGRLASSVGEDYGVRAMQAEREVPEDLREQYLKYRVNIRVLGVLRSTPKGIVFAASHRRLPHVGSKVAFLGDKILREIAGHEVSGADLGFFALGEFIYASGDKRLRLEPWMQVLQPAVVPKFDITQLVSRRTFIFARAGFGKSNLVKLLFSHLYTDKSPTVVKRGGREVPVGTIIFDPDGEYFWPDDKSRPGLCDVPGLQDQLVVFTRRRGPSEFYQSFVAGDIKLDIRRLRPSDVIGIALSPEKQDQQNVRKLKGLPSYSWEKLVDEIDRTGNQTDLDKIKELLHLEEGSDAEAIAARSNMTSIVRMLHDRSSQMMDILLAALREGKVCVLDVSQLRGGPALILSGLVLQRIFDTNQEEFTNAEPRTIPTIAVLEEAQAVLGATGQRESGESTYVAWVKEGRKYDLGAVLITQQPGSIRSELLSQGDNWFVFHLLSAGDLQSVRKANAHFSEDLLSGLLNEPIPGNGVFWSSSGGRPYPIPVRIMLFEDRYSTRDPDYTKSAPNNYASKLRKSFEKELAGATAATRKGKIPASAAGRGTDRHSDEREGQEAEERLVGAENQQTTDEHAPEDLDSPEVALPDEERATIEEPVDAIEAFRRHAIDEFRKNTQLHTRIRASGLPYKGVVVALEKALPERMDDRGRIAFELVPRAMNEVFGAQHEAWSTETRPAVSGSGTTRWIVVTERRSPRK